MKSTNSLIAAYGSVILAGQTEDNKIKLVFYIIGMLNTIVYVYRSWKEL